ncbi:fungal-specific transcription factor domain-containing protein [Paraphoma chrysanthemicola]|nr:fungal-specific transcription factor domain-containing protein [Paraphoma chrysanthemicola]
MAPLHESISLFQLPGNISVQPVLEKQTEQEFEARKGVLTSTAWRERAFERLTDTPEPFRSLLDSHFCWIQPIFNFVYRPAFTRDMKAGGPYFSQALFNTILSHSVRWCRAEPGMGFLLAPFDDGRTFSKDAVRYLFEDIQHGRSKVPTVQALLLLSAQECGRGNRTQAWLYSGMAFRLIDDMGICVDDEKYAKADQLSAEEVEIRNRLFWSCYLWDKIISLYFGRSPAIQNSEISPPKLLMDDTADLDIWTPHGIPFSHYSPKQAHSVSCFIQVCGLSEVLNQILIYLYNPSRNLAPSHAYEYALAAGSRLRDWWRDLPDHLRIDLTLSDLECPPSHIVTLNCLYHTINILLNRAKLKLSREPELAAAIAEHNPLIQCVSSATSIVALFALYSGAFGESHVVLALAYSVYTAGSIFLLEAQALGYAAPSTLERLALCVGTLKRLRETSPVLTTACHLMSRELDLLGIQLPEPTTSSTTGLRNQQLATRSLQSLSMDEHAPPPPPITNQSTTDPLSNYEDTILLDQLYLDQSGTSMHYNLLDMPLEMFENFSRIEPISVIMDPGVNMY